MGRGRAVRERERAIPVKEHPVLTSVSNFIFFCSGQGGPAAGPPPNGGPRQGPLSQSYGGPPGQGPPPYGGSLGPPGRAGPGGGTSYCGPPPQGQGSGGGSWRAGATSQLYEPNDTRAPLTSLPACSRKRLDPLSSRFPFAGLDPAILLRRQKRCPGQAGARCCRERGGTASVTPPWRGSSARKA